LKICFCGALALALVGSAISQQAPSPVPVEQEPHHHIVLKNDSVLVAHVVIPPGEATLYHTHSYDRAAIHLTNNMIALQQLNQPESLQMPAKIGEISASTRQGEPLTHRVRNAGPGPFEVIDGVPAAANACFHDARRRDSCGESQRADLQLGSGARREFGTAYPRASVPGHRGDNDAVEDDWA
jgi:hypothetical protein